MERVGNPEPFIPDGPASSTAPTTTTTTSTGKQLFNRDIIEFNY